MVPSAISPERWSIFGPMIPMNTGTGPDGGYASLTRSNEKYSPRSVSSSPSSRRRTDETHSRIAPTRERGISRIWRTHAGTPRPIPGRRRPGWIRASVEISVASSAGWRTIAETIPSPTGISRVAASAAAAPEMPPVKK